MGTMRPDILSAAALLLLGACAKEEIGEARYAVAQCQRLEVTDAVTGAAIRGAEDFVLDSSGQFLFISAYDRRMVEKAAKRRDKIVPSGGVYSASLMDVFSTDATSVTATPLTAPADFVGGLRPHGIAYDAINNELVFINRTYQRQKNRWKMTPRLQRIGANGEMFVGAYADAPCAANDVLVTGQQTFTSFDHSACNWRAGFEDVFNLKRSGLALGQEGRVFDQAAFANGLAQTDTGAIVMSATREKSLIVMKERTGAVEETVRIKVPGGPDNLSIASDGDVVAAVHPSLWRLGLNRKMGIGKAPSRIVKVDPESGAVELLFDDPSGRIFSAATIAIETMDGLVAGSVTDEGFLICREAL